MILNVVGKCIPGCESVEVVNSEVSKWKVKVSAGIISKRIEVRAETVERVAPERMVLKIESTEGDITGSWKIELHEHVPHITKIVLVADITARGSFELFVNQIIKNQFSKMASQFAACISEKAQAVSS